MENNKEFIGEYEDREGNPHKIFKLAASPLYCNERFFWYISKAEQVATLGTPNDYFVAVADALEARNGKEFERDKQEIVNRIRYAVENRALKWYHITIAIIEAFILVDDEELETVSVTHNKLKRELFQVDPAARFFFTSMALEYLENLPHDLTDTELADYLLKAMVSEPDIIESVMGELTSNPFLEIVGRRRAKLSHK